MLKMKKLIDQFGNEYPINNEGRPLIIGRNKSCDIVMPPVGSEAREAGKKGRREYLTVSRQHASYNTQDETIRDIKSAYGTKINDESLREGVPYQLNNGDCLILGGLELNYINE